VRAARFESCLWALILMIAGNLKHGKIVQWAIIGVTIVVTIFAMRYIREKQKAATPAVVYERRKRRQAQGSSFDQGTPSSLENGTDMQTFRVKPQVRA
jgi:hypothetical protein